MSEQYLSPKSIVPGVRLIMTIDRRVRTYIIDYALGTAILGLIPVYGSWIPAIRLTLLAILNLKMIFTIGRFWGHHKGQDVWANIGCFLAIISSLLLSLMVWLMVLLIGLFIPLVDSLARAVAYGFLTWSIGRTVSRYYYSPQTLDTEALQKALQFHRSHQNRNLRK